MSDNESLDHGFVIPWFTTVLDDTLKQSHVPTDTDYFPNDFPLDSTLITPDVSSESESSPLDMDTL